MEEDTKSARQRQILELMSSFNAVSDQYALVNPHLQDSNEILPIPVHDIRILEQSSQQESLSSPLPTLLSPTLLIRDDDQITTSSAHAYSTLTNIPHHDPAILPTSLGGATAFSSNLPSMPGLPISLQPQRLGAISLVGGQILTTRTRYWHAISSLLNSTNCAGRHGAAISATGRCYAERTY